MHLAEIAPVIMPGHRRAVLKRAMLELQQDLAEEGIEIKDITHTETPNHSEAYKAYADSGSAEATRLHVFIYAPSLPEICYSIRVMRVIGGSWDTFSATIVDTKLDAMRVAIAWKESVARQLKNK